MPHFVSEAIRPLGALDADVLQRGEPVPPSGFEWRGETLTIVAVNARRRGMKTDRGDVYLRRHYFDVSLLDGRHATIYFERQAKRGQARWFLYTID